MKQKKLVNWQDCMSVSADHLIQSDNFFLDRIREHGYQRLTSYNYGLMNDPVQESSVKLIVNSLHSDKVEVQLHYCRAITESGITIYYKPGKDEFISQTIKVPAKTNDRKTIVFNVYLVTDLFSRVPCGEPDINETPPRFPYADQQLSLQILQRGKNTPKAESNRLIIGRIRYSENSFELDQQYIPPCSSIKAHHLLRNSLDKQKKTLGQLEKYSLEIIKKIQSRSNESVLATHIQELCKNLLNALSPLFFLYRNTIADEPPITAIGHYSSIAGVLHVHINALKHNEKEELLKYFYEWSDITPASFENLVTQCMDLEYDHQNIAADMLVAENFLYSLGDLWKKLNQLDYIGQHKESIVVSESSTEAEEEDNKRWRIIG